MDHDLVECEICLEMFDPEDLTQTFYWTVCDDCEQEHKDQE